MSEINIEQIDDDGFLVGDGEPTQAENALLREIKGDTSTIINLMKGTQRLQRDALKATQAIIKPKSNQSGNVQPPVNLAHPNRQSSSNQNRSPGNASTVQANSTARPRIQQNQQRGTGSTQQPERTSTLNRQRDENGRFVGADNQANDSTQGYGNRDGRGRFVGNGQGAADRAANSRLTDSLKDLNNNLTLNANTDRIDPMIDAMKEVGDIASVGIDAGKKALSVSNTLIAKPAMALGRGIKGLFKPKTDAINSPVAWYKRIWRTLERGNRQDQVQHTQEQRRLDEIARGQGQRGSADSGLLAILGLGLAGLLAGLKTIIPKLGDLVPDILKKQDNESPVPVLRAPKIPTISSQSVFARLADTKLGKGLSKVLKKLPFISSALEAGAGGINAINIANDEFLTEAEKQRRQAQNAGSTLGAIGGGLGGAAAGAAIGTALIPIPVLGTIIGGILGGWLGTDGGRIVGDKIGGWVDDLRKADIVGRISNAWNGFIDKITPSFSGIKETIVDLLKPNTEAPIDFLKNPPTAKMSPNTKPVPIVGSIYAGKETELYKNYQKWREADTTGKGIITLDDFKKSKYVKQNPNLLKQFEPVVTKKTKSSVKGFTPEKAKSIQATAERLGVNPNHLAQIIAFETGGSFDPAQKNLAGGSARGLIQFMPDTAKSLGTTTEALAAMSFDEQMVFVERYFKERGIGKNGSKTSLADMYNAVQGVPKTGYKKGSKAYAANEIWDTNKDGVILPSEAINSKDFKEHAKQYFAAIPKPTAKTATVPIPTAKATSVPTSSVNASQLPVVKAEQQPTRLNNTPPTVKVSIAKPLVGQNMSDRGIAHIVTGGIGEVTM